MDHSFFEGLSGRIVTPGDPSYGEDRQGWNRGVQKYPLVINYCRTGEDVSQAVLWARRNSIPIRIRNGGHNYEGYSNGNGVLVIDVSEMTRIELDEQRHTVRVQGGVTNQQLYQAVGSLGYPFPGGTCPTVGVCGYAMGGGWGLSCRYLGLGCDSLAEAELVDSRGKLLRANKTQHSDLFWALRGAGGGNFGVVVSATFKLPKPVEQVTLIEIDYPNADQQGQQLFLHTWQEWIKNADWRTTLISRIYRSEQEGLSMLVRGICYGDIQTAEASVCGFLELKGAVANLQTVSFLEATQILGSTYPPYEKFQSASRFVCRCFNPWEIADLVDLIQNPPKGSVYTGLSMYALGGSVARTNIDDTAFFYRKAHYIVWLETIWEENVFARGNIQWVHRQFPCLESLTTGAYVNFPYSGLCDYLPEYYGEHVEALEAVKEKYDPCNVFSFPQGLEPQEEWPVVTGTPLPEEPGPSVQAMPNRGAAYRGFRYVNPGS